MGWVMASQPTHLNELEQCCEQCYRTDQSVPCITGHHAEGSVTAVAA